MPETVAPGRVLGGRYRLTRELARGGMATVWDAQDPLLSRRVAVKILHPVLAIDESVRARFRHEAIAAAKLTHPAIVATYDTGDDGVAYIVMQLVEGPTLRRMLDQRGPLPAGEAADIAAQVAEALDHAHEHGVVHRDIKPANVLVPPDGQIKVTDFGIAKATGDEDLTRTGTVVGTARYLAPEQVSGDPVDGRADVYALGLVLYEMLTGELPFTGDTEVSTAMARLTRTPEPVRARRHDVPPALDSVVSRCLALEPEDRFPTANALFMALEPVREPPSGSLPAVPRVREPIVGADPTIGVDRTAASPRAPSQPPAPPAPGAPRKRRGWRVIAVLVVLAVLAAVTFAAVRAVLDDDNGGGGGGTPPEAVPIAVVGVSDFDPDGDVENPDATGQAIDADPDTVWATERYENRDFDDPKRGVGLTFELDAGHTIDSVEVVADDSDWNAEIYVSDAPGESLADWGRPVAQDEGLGALAHFDLPDGTEGRSVLLWITRLPADGKLGIAEVTIVG